VLIIQKGHRFWDDGPLAEWLHIVAAPGCEMDVLEEKPQDLEGALSERRLKSDVSNNR
jgi:hypothetical protein